MWVLNLDAEEELARPAGYNPTAKLGALTEQLLPAARTLLSPGDVLLDPKAPERHPGRLGRAWCPTPRALRLLARAGAVVPPTPPLAVIRAVNHRRFGLEIGGGLPGAAYFQTGQAALDRLDQEASQGAWMVKRPFSFAGRGQRRIQGRPRDDDRRWLLSERSRDGLLVEPYVDIARELSIHGWVTLEGGITLGRVCEQFTDEHRAWVRTAPVDVPAAREQQLVDQAREVASALLAAGYFGPFGIDAYEYRDQLGALQLNPLGELNARYTMGYAVGMLGRL